MNDFKEYQAKEGINFSLLKKYMQSPAHYLWAKEHPEEDEDTQAKRLGRAVHCYVLEQSKFEAHYVTLDLTKRPMPDKDFRTKVNADWKKVQLDYIETCGKDFITETELSDIQNMAIGLGKSESALNLLKGCSTESTIEWIDKDTGVPCKARVDFHKQTPAIALHGDLKSMDDASPGSISGYVKKWLTYMQLAFYGDGLEAVCGVPFNSPFIIAMEKKPPFLCQPYFPEESDIELGRTMYKSLLNIHKKCLESGVWGGYETMYETVNGVIVSKLPDYYYSQLQNIPALQNN